MAEPGAHELTELLLAWGDGDEEALARRVRQQAVPGAARSFRPVVVVPRPRATSSRRAEVRPPRQSASASRQHVPTHRARTARDERADALLTRAVEHCRSPGGDARASHALRNDLPRSPAPTRSSPRTWRKRSSYRAPKELKGRERAGSCRVRSGAGVHPRTRGAYGCFAAFSKRFDGRAVPRDARAGRASAGSPVGRRSRPCSGRSATRRQDFHPRSGATQLLRACGRDRRGTCLLGLRRAGGADARARPAAAGPSWSAVSRAVSTARRIAARSRPAGRRSRCSVAASTATIPRHTRSLPRRSSTRRTRRLRVRARRRARAVALSRTKPNHRRARAGDRRRRGPRAKSGALITADFALEEGREVFAVPGEITSALSAGTNALLRLGATPLTSSADVLELFGLQAPVEAEADLERAGRGDPRARWTGRRARTSSSRAAGSRRRRRLRRRSPSSSSPGSSRRARRLPADGR